METTNITVRFQYTVLGWLTVNIKVFGNSDAGQSDVRAIVEFVAKLEYAQQHELPDAFMDLFRKTDPIWTTAGGNRLSGWDGISTFTHKVLPGAVKESTATYEVARILFVRPDVAVVNVHQRPIHLDGSPLEGAPEGRPTYILAKDDGYWKIAAAQNTYVQG